MHEKKTAGEYRLNLKAENDFQSLRHTVIAACSPYIEDVVLTRSESGKIGALLFPSEKCSALSSLPPGTPREQILESPSVLAYLQSVLSTIGGDDALDGGCVEYAHLMIEPPSAVDGEVHLDGSISQSAVLRHRKFLIGIMHEGKLYPTIHMRSKPR